MEILEDNNFESLYTLCVHPIDNQLWQYPPCNVNQSWQPDELHQLLLSLVNDLLHWLLNFLKARNVKDHLDNRFTLVQ
jgi:hypothetical protein